ncbi:hypothetical protein BKA57DRAFT_457022 [Linnemannia elongata]|nr:hypothetical protein BKA57DRAFT_457022 [Linnemannia elongata]
MFAFLPHPLFLSVQVASSFNASKLQKGTPPSLRPLPPSFLPLLPSSPQGNKKEANDASKQHPHIHTCTHTSYRPTKSKR